MLGIGEQVEISALERVQLECVSADVAQVIREAERAEADYERARRPRWLRNSVPADRMMTSCALETGSWGLYTVLKARG